MHRYFKQLVFYFAIILLGHNTAIYGQQPSLDNSGFNTVDDCIVANIIADENDILDEETQLPVDFFNGKSVDIELLDFATYEYATGTITGSEEGLVIVEIMTAFESMNVFAVLDAKNDQLLVIDQSSFHFISTSARKTAIGNSNPLIKFLLKLASKAFKKSPKVIPKPKLPVPKVGGLKKQVEIHKKRLADYKKNPDAFDNKGFLKNAPPERRKKIIETRIRNLENQIKDFEKQIDNLGG